jgi:hypothetical protein
MYARSVTLHIDTDKWDELHDFGEEISRRISGFPGLISWVLVANPETGDATSFSLFEDEKAFLAVNDRINEIVADFRRFFTDTPSELLGPVVAQLEAG